MKLGPIAALCLTAVPALADNDALPLTYALFETAVAHADLEQCPKTLAKDGVFCRATMRHDEIHVFAFSEEGDNLLVGFESFPFEELAAHLN